MSELSQAVARASEPFIKGVSKVLNCEFTPEQRLAVCNELEALVTTTIIIVKFADAQPSDVVETNAPILIEAIETIIGRSVTDDEEKKKLLKHIQAVTMLTLLIGASMQEKPTQEKE